MLFLWGTGAEHLFLATPYGYTHESDPPVRNPRRVNNRYLLLGLSSRREGQRRYGRVEESELLNSKFHLDSHDCYLLLI